MTQIKNFFRLLKYELIRILRNKVVVFMLLFFSIGMLLLIKLLTGGVDVSYPIAIQTINTDYETLKQNSLISENFSLEKSIFVSSYEEGIDLVKTNKVCLFLVVDASEDPEKYSLYYDNSNIASKTMVSYFENKKVQVTYEGIVDYLYDEYSIRVDKEYLDVVSFKSANPVAIDQGQMLFSMEVAVTISIVLMFGIAYSLARDNETSVSKNINFMPLTKNKYLLSKTIPFVVLGFFEMFLLLIIGQTIFNINYQTNFFAILLISMLFVIATTVLGTLFGSFKSQIAAVFCDMVFILVPLFVLTTAFIQSLFLPIQIFLYMFPMLPFVLLFNSMMYGGLINWLYVAILFVQIVIYYLVTYFILKSKVDGKLKV